MQPCRKLTIDHIIARKRGGQSSEDNLALACYYRNSYKGPNVAGIDPDSGEVVRLVSAVIVWRGN